MSVLIAYLSYSGNTEEIAELIAATCRQKGIATDLYEISFGPIPDMADYDIVCLGSFTWDYGATPGEVKDFVAEVGYKPERVAIFGSGDTQFGGDDMFCAAVEKLVRFYHSPWKGLKIEQSPRGQQEKLVHEWIERVLQHDEVITGESEDVRAEISQ